MKKESRFSKALALFLCVILLLQVAVSAISDTDPAIKSGMDAAIAMAGKAASTVEKAVDPGLDVVTIMVDDVDPAITYSDGGWSAMNKGYECLVYQATVHQFKGEGTPSVQYAFEGCGIEFLTSYTGESWGADFNVCITGQDGTEVVSEEGSMKDSTYGTGWGGVAYRKTGLPAGAYTITITFAVAANEEADVDAFRVHSPAPAEELNEQQAYLKKWYQSMDPSKGYIDLFEDELSLLTLNQNPFGGINSWPTYNAMTKPYSWTVRARTAQTYDVSVACNGEKDAVLKVTSGENSVEFTIPYNGVNRYDLGSLAIPERESTLTLSLEAGNGASTRIVQLELLPAAGKAHYDALLQESRARPNWMKDNPIGAFYQYGEWGQNPDGSHGEWPACYENIDWDAFAERLSTSGVDYLVWSVTWSQYYVAAPIAAVDAVLPGHTTEHDYLQDILNACEERGIEVVFYYHAGWDSSMEHTPAKAWWDAMYRDDLPNGNHARKEHFMDRWMNIVEEIGTRYGDQLAGWMFDYTNSYNIGPFEKMLEAARSGNTDRMITFNGHNAGMYGPTYTPLADYYMGEAPNYTPGVGDTFGGVPFRLADGRYDSGPFAGQESHFCFVTENGGSWGGWGVDRFAGATPLSPKFSQTHYNDVVFRALKNKQAMSFCFQMFEDGTVCDESYARLKKAVELAKQSLIAFDDTDQAATYSATGWEVVTNAAAGEGAYHVSTAQGASCEFDFTGSGITLVTTTGPKFGEAELYIDGKLTTTINLYSDTLCYKSVVYDNTQLAPGNHMIKIVSKSPAKISVDSFIATVMPSKPILTAGKHNDNAANYSAGWGSTSNASFYMGDYSDQSAPVSGGSVTLDFNGTGIEIVGCMGSYEGTAEIFIDGESLETVNCYAADYSYQDTIFSKKDLQPGLHTLKIVKKDNKYFKFDAFEVFGDPVATYSITTDKVSHGFIKTNKQIAVEGDTVRIDATARDGYRLRADSLKVYKTGELDASVSVVNNQFTMPAYAVSVTAVFDEVLEIPVYTKQPEDARVTAGQTATFTVAASGIPAPTYQWQIFTDEATGWKDIQGATAETFTTGTLQTGDSGALYHCVATNKAGFISSSTATLTVQRQSNGSNTNAPPDQVTTTQENKDGSSSTIVTDKKTGTVVETAKYSDGSKVVTTTTKDGASRAVVTVPKVGEKTTVAIPTAEKPAAGMVAVIVKADGTKEVVKTSFATADGVRVTLTDGATIELIDNTKTFTDVKSGDWHKDAVTFATSRELFSGTSTNSFAPTALMTRAMLMTVLYRYEGANVKGTGDSWYADSMAWAKEIALSDGTNPNGSVTREQLATMLYRYAKPAETVAADTSKFTDADKVSAYASEAMNWAIGTGLISGKGNNLLDPQAGATRAEVATVLMRLCKNI